MLSLCDFSLILLLPSGTPQTPSYPSRKPPPLFAAGNPGPSISYEIEGASSRRSRRLDDPLQRRALCSRFMPAKKPREISGGWRGLGCNTQFVVLHTYFALYKNKRFISYVKNKGYKPFYRLVLRSKLEVVFAGSQSLAGVSDYKVGGGIRRDFDVIFYSVARSLPRRSYLAVNALIAA